MWRRVSIWRYGTRESPKVGIGNLNSSSGRAVSVLHCWAFFSTQNSVPFLAFHFLSISLFFPLFSHSPLLPLYTILSVFIFYFSCIEIFWHCLCYIPHDSCKWIEKKELNSQGSRITCGFELQCGCWQSNLGLLEKHPEFLTAVIHLQIPT